VHIYSLASLKRKNEPETNAQNLDKDPSSLPMRKREGMQKWKDEDALNKLCVSGSDSKVHTNPISDVQQPDVELNHCQQQRDPAAKKNGPLCEIVQRRREEGNVRWTGRKVEATNLLFGPKHRGYPAHGRIGSMLQHKIEAIG
jgi:hypothetical protein